MRNFLNTPTVNPMRNTLRRAVEALDVRMQESLSKNWDTFFTSFQKSCARYIEQRPQQGLYTTGAWSVISACYHMSDITPDVNSQQVFTQLSINAEEMLQQCEEVDIRVEMYWYSFAEQYGDHMPHCNNRIMEDFQREVAKAAHKEYVHIPDRDIRFTGLEAVQAATIAIARAHPENEGIGADMTRVSKIAHEQKWCMLSDIMLTVEPKDIVLDEPDGNSYEAFMEHSGTNPFSGELRRALFSLTPKQLEVIEEHWDTFKKAYDEQVDGIHTEYSWAGPYQVAMYALREVTMSSLKNLSDGQATEQVDAYMALDAYVSQNMVKATELDRQMLETLTNYAQHCFEAGQSSACTATILHEYMDAVEQEYMNIAFKEPNKMFMTNIYDAIIKAADAVDRMHHGAQDIQDSMRCIKDAVLALKNEMLSSHPVPYEFAEQVASEEWEETI